MDKDEEIEQLRTLLQESEQNVLTLGQEIAGLQHSLRRAGQAETALRNQLNKVQETEPDADDVKALLHLWRDEVKAGDKRVKVEGQGPRRDRVKWAVRKYGANRVHDAIMGATLDDWAMGRDPRLKGRQLNDLAKHILKDEETVERFEGFWLEARAKRSGAVMVPAEPALLPDADHVEAWADRLLSHNGVLGRLRELCGWEAPVMRDLRIGFDDEHRRVTIPILNADGALINVLRFKPGGEPRMLAVHGCPRDLFPAPETIDAPIVWVVMDETNAVTARQLGLPAVAIPGPTGWDDAWAPRFTDQSVVVVARCDVVGRNLASRVANSLVQFAMEVRVIDPMPSMTSGFDLTDMVVAGGTLNDLTTLAAAAAPIRRLRAA